MISAKEAKELCPKNVERCLSELDTQIRNAASIGRTYLRVPYDMTKVKGYSISLVPEELETKLKALGYTIKDKYEDRQFADIYLEIHWGD